MNKEVANLLQGYKKMNELTEKERITLLPTLTIEDARSRYIDLCQVWEQSKRSSGDLQLLDQLKIEENVKRRHSIDRLTLRGRRYDRSI
ncbi:MAG: hypothetical protein COS84_11970 [Armatimonadetes bacterium CG07_land_8_20_14_0_80_40_9]|nr:MAG: hypothetical protein COS84_11970 [Armatimonadetes bacterium CG07_land_8_20_14_0_80_40_9]